jgi:predicted ATPase/DNA-binding SARP family transcriptional activator
MTSSVASSAAAGPAGAGALPVPLTRFVGRACELAEAARLLAGTRLLTLTGPGGIGKTRLALELARGEAAAGREVMLAELASLSEPALVVERVAAVAGAREAGSSLEALGRALAGRDALLVLDNCEHLVETAAALAAALLRAAPRLRVVATSREALGVAGETAWSVPPLSLPDDAAEATAASLDRAEAVQLFVERAQASYPLFRLTDENAAAVARICRRLDGLPLALELAAARVRVLPVEQIAERLGDVFRLLGSGSRAAEPRHRTLRAAIDWSYALLCPEEQRLLERLSVFVCGFPLEGAEAVGADGDLRTEDVLDRLAALIDKSLVAMREFGDTARYRLHEPVRQYARERLREAGAEDAALERHARWCLTFVRRQARPLLTAEWEARRLLEREHDDCRAALGWSLAAGLADEIALPLAAGLAWFWYYQIYWEEGRRWLETALAAAGDRPGAERATALRGAGAIALMLGDAAQARSRLEAGAAVCRALGDEQRLGFMLAGLVQAHVAAGDLDAARRYLAESFAVAERVGGFLRTYVRVNAELAVMVATGDYAGAEAALDAGEASLEPDDDGTPMLAASWRAQLALWRGELDRAEAAARRAIELSLPQRQGWFVARGLRVLGHAAARRGAPERGARLLGAADAQLRRIGAVAPLYVERPAHERGLAELRASLGGDRFDECFAAGARRPLDELLREELNGGAPASTRAASARPAPDPLGPPDLRVCALGPLRVERAGTEVPREAWGSSKTRELLLFLLSHPSGCTREQVGAALWPDASAPQVRNVFHVTLHRLRKALGRADWIVADDGRYRVAPGLRVELDAERFERDVTEALRLPADASGRLPLLARALETARGEFLEQEPVGDWHLEIRERLARLWRDAAHACGALLASGGELAAAAEVLRALVVRDPLDEEGCRELMRVLARAGERSEALRLHRRLAVLLDSELQVAPDDETEALAGRIAAGEPV